MCRVLHTGLLGSFYDPSKRPSEDVILELVKDLPLPPIRRILRILKQPDVVPSKWAKLAKKAGAKPVDFE